jgi:hypothetical protein
LQHFFGAQICVGVSAFFHGHSTSASWENLNFDAILLLYC